MALTFLKKGKAAHKLMEKVEAEQEAKKAASENFTRRFWIPDGGETRITFLDGELDDEGLLSTVSYWEHQLKMNGHFRNWFPCTQIEEPCPICEGGEATPSLVSVFTIIDHSEWKDKNGNTHKNEKSLFVCKRETFKRLQKIAAKRGGLAGITFEVSRTGDKSPNVGDSFDYEEKSTPKELMEKYGLSKDEVTPYDYEKVIEYRDAKALRKLGFGLSDSAIGASDGDALETGGGVGDYSDEV